MKFFLIYLISLPAFAAHYQIIGGQSSVPAFEGELNILSEAESVGSFSVRAFKQNQIPYQGSESGFSSILNTPTGSDAIEIINDKEMRAYGWCYEVDGFQPDVMADQVVMGNAKLIKWFYAFSHYRDGQWISYCEPAYTVKRP